ncbi:AlpA family transcriptional regulator [Paracoccus sp. SY]|uniref:helix-turn-helix transcriptional regulator n=1 Tax=Paracoccus sp. SY TaxID=1330255 RepID=UPI000CCFF540|nr:AlpA family phage regulatory protein [Paracoccus sp. SY]
MPDEILRLSNVLSITGMSRSWLYCAAAEGRFPSPVRLGARAIGWKRSDVQAWLDSRERVL